MTFEQNRSTPTSSLPVSPTEPEDPELGGISLIRLGPIRPVRSSAAEFIEVSADSVTHDRREHLVTT
jgi:hypothetical protein